MKYHRNLKPWLCVSDDKDHAVLSETYLDIAGTGDKRTGKLVATDGVMIVIIPVEIDERDQPGHIGKGVFAAARKIAKKAVDKLQILLGRDSVTFDDLSGMHRRTGIWLSSDSRYPNWRQIDIAKKDIPTENVIAFDAQRLWLMAEAMGCLDVQISFKDNLSPIYVKPIWPCDHTRPTPPVTEPEAHGILSPKRLS